MAVNRFSSQVTTNVTLTTTTETVVRTLSGVSTGRAQDIELEGWAQLTTGTATTGVIPRIRRGTDITGTLIDEGNTITIGAAAGGTETFTINARDEGVDASGVSYVLTLQQVAATADGTCLGAMLSATVQV